MAKLKNVIATAAISLFSTGALACDPVPIEPCNKSLEKFLKLDQKSLDRLAEKAKEFDKLLDQAIVAASKTKAYPRGSCFNQHFYSMRIEEIRLAAIANSGETCSAHVKLLSKPFDPTKYKEMSFAFDGQIPSELKKIILEVESARQAFIKAHKRR